MIPPAAARRCLKRRSAAISPVVHLFDLVGGRVERGGELSGLLCGHGQSCASDWSTTVRPSTDHPRVA
jgi:hypothetical protein